MDKKTYPDEIYQLNELITIVYKAVYAKSGKYLPDFIDVSNLNLERFKLTDYDLDTIFEKNKIKFVEKHPTGMKNNGVDIEELRFKCQGDIYMFNIRIVPYQNKEALTNIRDPVNVNLILRNLLSELVTTGRTNNILVPIINVDVAGSDLSRSPSTIYRFVSDTE